MESVKLCSREEAEGLLKVSGKRREEGRSLSILKSNKAKGKEDYEKCGLVSQKKGGEDTIGVDAACPTVLLRVLDGLRSFVQVEETEKG